MHKEKSAFPQSPGIRARSDYIISAHTAEINQYTTISQEIEHLQGWGLHITQQFLTPASFEHAVKTLGVSFLQQQTST